MGLKLDLYQEFNTNLTIVCIKLFFNWGGFCIVGWGNSTFLAVLALNWVDWHPPYGKRIKIYILY